MKDFIAIGDTVVDAFIKLKEAEIGPDEKSLILSFGDKVPYESVEEIPAVGNSANATVSASRLGLNCALYTVLGSDENGRKCLDKLSSENVSTEYISIDRNKKTNYHYVLWYMMDRTILIKHEKYEYKLPDFNETKWIYLSSLGESAFHIHDELVSYLEKHPDTKLAFQPGTFQIKTGVEKLQSIYKRSKIFFCNVEEAGRILGQETLGIKELLKRMRSLGPEIVVITDGPKGAYAYDGTNFIFQPPYPDQNPAFERTGAGDAFASTTVSALALGESLNIALKWASVNSMSVVQEVGAQKGLLSRSLIQKYLEEANEDFNPKSL
jgi:sugar/nucleoside kinase (ribokinase family)